jgi:endoglucanase
MRTNSLPARRVRSRRSMAIVAALSLVVAAGTVTAVRMAFAASSTGEFNYAEALQDSMLFFESQRSGKLPADNRVLWRGDSDLSDGSDHSLDLTGGYHDAGDEVKFGLPEAYSMTALAWGGIDDAAGYNASGQMQYLLRNLRWGDDYIIKAHPSANVFYGQVGDGNSDHSFWGPAEVNPEPRPSYAITASCPGSDLAGQAAAALAASSILFKSSDASYSATLLSHAKSLYTFADTDRGTYDKCITGASGFYTSFSGYWDELVWGALWLYKATGDSSYLTKAVSYVPNLGKTQDGTPKYAWTISWDDSTYASYILLAQLTGDQQYVADAERNLDWFTTGVNGQHVNMSPGGEAQVDVWGTARYAANEAYLALEFSNWLKAQGTDATRQKAYHDFAVAQLNYILGDNPNHLSYEVGFTNGGRSSAWPQNIHNRTAHGSWDQSMSDPPTTRHLDFGLLVGGPTSGDGFTDDRNNYQQTEGALDYNALFSGALAELTAEYGGTPRTNFPPKETPDGPEELMQASLNQTGTNFVEIKTQTVNKSGWPARHLTNGSFRYYFTLDAGETASQVTLTSPYNQCSAPTGPTQYSGSTYYVTVSCAGQDIAPAGQSAFHRETQFRLTFPAAHDYTKDWSFQGIPAAVNATPVNVNNIVLYDGTTQVWGNQPNQSTTSPSPSIPVSPSAQVSASPSPATSPSPSVSPSRSASTSPSASPSQGGTGGCTAAYSLVNQWPGGFQAQVNVTAGTAAINHWRVTWTFPSGQTISQYWSATVTQSGSGVTATDAGFNGALSPGTSTSFGFIGTWGSANNAPTNVACTSS